MIETVPPGTVLHGRYRIERELGSGGFGHVYLATDLATNQPAAVKEYLVTGAGGQEQLKHEATVLSRLHHPNLPAFLDAFMEHGRYYVVLNYIEGHDLTDLVMRTARQRNEVIPIAQIMGWILSICDAVQFLHHQQPSVIHRDIKPDNIRITPDGTAVLVDLGNAKAAADGARTLLFIRHQGTPGYAPPEQYPGGSGTDTRSDIYALGATLYFALTAQEPPSVSTRNQFIQQGKPDLPSLQERLASNPPPVSPETDEIRQFRLGINKPTKPAPRHLRHIAQLGTLPPELLNQLNMIIQRSMAIRAKGRYQYIVDFAHDLKRVMAALPTPPTPTSSRPADPNSTQPDLPKLYEAMQAAKDKPDASASATNASQAPSSIPTRCPRCDANLRPGTPFCPRCGTAFAPNAPHTNGVGHDISRAQTVVVTPSSIQAVTQNTQRPPSMQSSSSNNQSTRNPAQGLNHAPPGHVSQQEATPPVMTWGNSDQNASSSRSKSNLKNALIILV
ncbi:MAG TPA: protein kinase, partial [Ktedonobacteraceae bacterium]|nr:protein kinase [Ktedonobacteraceae bacterium]